MYHRGVEEGGVGWQRRKHRGGNRGVFCETGSCRDQGPLFGYSSTAWRTLGYVKDVGEGMQLEVHSEGSEGHEEDPWEVVEKVLSEQKKMKAILYLVQS